MLLFTIGHDSSINTGIQIPLLKHAFHSPGHMFKTGFLYYMVIVFFLEKLTHHALTISHSHQQCTSILIYSCTCQYLSFHGLYTAQHPHQTVSFVGSFTPEDSIFLFYWRLQRWLKQYLVVPRGYCWDSENKNTKYGTSTHCAFITERDSKWH